MIAYGFNEHEVQLAQTQMISQVVNPASELTTNTVMKQIGRAHV